MNAPADAQRAGAAPPRKPRPLLRHPFRRKNFRPRAFAIYAAGVAAIAAADPLLWTFLAGLALVLAGQALRLWATGYLVKTDELTTAGPYAHIRHPLYAGTLLMGSGFLLMAGPRVAATVLPLGLAFYFGYYLSYKERIESERLEQLYGDVYRSYRAAVPAIVPRIRRRHTNEAVERRSWQLERVVENDEQTVLAYAAIVTAALTAMGFVRGF